MVLPEINHLVAYTTRKTVDRLSRGTHKSTVDSLLIMWCQLEYITNQGGRTLRKINARNKSSMRQNGSLK